MGQGRAWLYILAGGTLELFWMSGLKYAQGFWQFFFTFFIAFISFALMIKALKVLEVGLAYSVYVGFGTLGISLAEIFYFGASPSFYKLFFIFLIFISVVGLKLSQGS